MESRYRDLKSLPQFLARVESLKDHDRLHLDARKKDRKSDISTNDLLVNTVRKKQSDLSQILWTGLNRIRST